MGRDGAHNLAAAAPATPGTPAVSVRALTREFKVYEHRPGLAGALRNLVSSKHTTVRAVDGISFDIAAGEMVGFLGPNGAGKSTVIKMLTGILVPTSGEATVHGVIPWKQRQLNARSIGVVFGQRSQLWWDLPPSEAFDLLGRIYRVPSDAFHERLAFFIRELELAPFLSTPVRKLSLGQRMRCELTAAMLHGPRVLFLDEPTIGLDIVARDRVREFLRRINREQGVTVLLTTHDLGDVEQLCRRVIVIDRGSVLHDGTLDSLHRLFGHTRRVVVDLAEEGGAAGSAGAHDVGLPLPDGARITAREGRRVTVSFDAEKLSAPVLLAQILSSWKVAELSVQDSDIEDVVRRIYLERTSGRQPTGGSAATR
jgi:ABC-2 type transport system ATP-binding protein